MSFTVVQWNCSCAVYSKDRGMVKDFVGWHSTSSNATNLYRKWMNFRTWSYRVIRKCHASFGKGRKPVKLQPSFSYKHFLEGRVCLACSTFQGRYGRELRCSTKQLCDHSLSVICLCHAISFSLYCTLMFISKMKHRDTLSTFYWALNVK